MYFLHSLVLFATFYCPQVNWHHLISLQTLLWLGQQVHTGGGKCTLLQIHMSIMTATKASTMTVLTVATQVHSRVHRAPVKLTPVYLQLTSMKHPKRTVDFLSHLRRGPENQSDFWAKTLGGYSDHQPLAGVKLLKYTRENPHCGTDFQCANPTQMSELTTQDHRVHSVSGPNTGSVCLLTL